MDWEDSPYVQGPVTPPVAGSGLLLVAAPHQHRVVALDATTGSHRWTYTAGGRVDTSPTLAGNFCIFGAHDGYVYCLRLGDGELVWRFRAAPQESRIAAYGQLESPWPVTGSVLVEDGKAYAAAGRHPNSDGGVVVLAIGLSNGELAWEKRLTDTGVTNWYAGMLANTRQKVGVDFDPVDLLVRDGQSIAMSRWQFNPANGDVTLCFDRTNYQAFGSVEVPRGPWGYGIRQTKLVLDKPPLVFNAAGITRGATNETALLLAGSQVIRAREDGTLSFGDTSVKLESAVVRDGLIAARGRLYATTQDGKVYCFAGVE
jgi:outer membrane protein assembly factor BamB